MSTPDEKATPTERAFAPLHAGPRSLGRREYDQVKWWVTAIKTLGFPIVVAWYALTQLAPALDRLAAAQDRHTQATIALLCRLDPPSCARMIDKEPP
jgi:hypothetical protein